MIEEIWDIMHWALAEPDPQGWWARSKSTDNLALVQRNDGAFKRHLDRWKHPQRGVSDGLPPQAHRDAAKSPLLEPLQARLDHAPYLGGATPCTTDLAVMPFVRQYAATDPDWFAAPLARGASMAVRLVGQPAVLRLHAEVGCVCLRASCKSCHDRQELSLDADCFPAGR